MKVQRVAVTDVITRDAESAVLIDGVIVRLSPISSAIWELAKSPVDVRVLAKELSSRFGAPQDGTALAATKGTVAELLRHGVLRTTN